MSVTHKIHHRSYLVGHIMIHCVKEWPWMTHRAVLGKLRNNEANVYLLQLS